MYAPDERADTLPLFLHYPYIYSVVYTILFTATRRRNRDYAPFSQWSNEKKKKCHNLFFSANLLLASTGKPSAFLRESTVDRPKRKEREAAMIVVCRKVKGENFNDIP